MKRKTLVTLILSSLLAATLSGCASTALAQNTDAAAGATEADKVQDTKAAAGSTIAGDAQIAKSGSFRTAKEEVDAITVGWNLGNTLDATSWSGMGKEDLSSETSWGNPAITQEMIDGIKEAGFNTVRLPVTWCGHMDPETHEVDAEWMARVTEVVDYILEDDLYCIVNVHHDTGDKGWIRATAANFEENKDAVAQLWQQIAENFRDYDDRLMFEGFNEMLDDNAEWSNPKHESIAAVNDYNQLYIDTIRASGGNNAERNLICNTYAAGCGSTMLNGFVLPTDSADGHLIAEIHDYAPYNFVAPEHPETTTWTEAEVRSGILSAHTTFASRAVPCIIGEFGCAPKEDGEARYAWADYFCQTAADKKMPVIWWDNGNAKEYGIYDRKGNAIADQRMMDILLQYAQ